MTNATLHIATCTFKLQGGLTMQWWSSKVLRCTMHIAHCRGNLLHNANRKVVSQCGGGLFLPGLEGGAWWSSQEGRGDEQKSWKRNPSIQHH